MRWLITLTLLLAPWLAHASQTAFRTKHQNGHVILAYKWEDRHRDTYTIQFNLPQDAVSQGNREFVAFDNTTANNHAYTIVRDYIHSQNIKGLDIQKTRQGFNLSYNGPSYRSARVQQLMEEAQTLRDKAYNDFISNAYYTRMDDKTIMPDHKRIAKRYIKAMRPVAEALAKDMRSMTQRERINHLMHFLQSIPYDTLTNRYNSNGAGFQTPYGLLINNKGDCDTKAVALMALLRNFYPKMRMVMVYVKDHAFIAINMPPKAGEKTLQLNNTPFIIADPTGPAQVKLGEPDPRALKALKKGAYSYQELSF